MKQFIAVAGNIGVGKTTFAQLLAQHFQIPLFPERFIENPYLLDFYQDMSKWAFHSQLFFLLHNFKAHQEIQKLQVSCIKDRTIYEDSEVFATNLFQQGCMSERDYQCYRELYTTLMAILPYPNLVIYLRASTAVLRQRIQERNRSFESHLNLEYLTRLNAAYDEWAQRMQRCTETLIVETDDFNVFQDQIMLNRLFETIAQRLSRGDP
ncbi:deoxynucleoside kinase [candidate division KSB1 bacterium]|nr:deoxynucleoside kinase [candidate division KSB1 bacterium]